MKSLFVALIMLIALVAVCYFYSEKGESDNVSEAAGSTDARGAYIPPPDSVHASSASVELPDSRRETKSEPAKQEVSKRPKSIVPAKPTSGYYSTVADLNDDQLKEALHKLIRGHRVLSYGELWEALRDLDRGDDAHVVLIYDRSQRSSSKNGGDQGDWNREHLWPRAYGVRRSSPANTDLHHIRASDVGINGKRGHLYFDETQGEDFSGKRYSFDLDSWEPPNEVKGDVARAMFYMALRYEGNDAGSIDLELSDLPDLTKGVHGKLSTLLEWHKKDPVSDEEKSRNEKIHRSYQGNRNPFIDHPEWVGRVYP